jgi:hypothetical protein
MSEQLYRRIEVEAFGLMPLLRNGSEVFRDGEEPIVAWVPVVPCEHGMNDGHMIVGRFENGIWISDPIGDDWEPRANWCEGAGLGGSDG